MESRSQGIQVWRRVAAELGPILGLLAFFGVAVAVAWRLITTMPLPKEAVRPAPPEPPFLSVAGAAVDIELFAPDGRHTSTLSPPDTSAKIAMSDGHVECDNYGDPKATESNCTASVVVRRPASGEYRVEVTASDRRSETLNVGWGGEGFRRAGGFDLPVTVEPRAPVRFTIVVSPEGVWLRGQPRR